MVLSRLGAVVKGLDASAWSLGPQEAHCSFWELRWRACRYREEDFSSPILTSATVPPTLAEHVRMTPFNVLSDKKLILWSAAQITINDMKSSKLVT